MAVSMAMPARSTANEISSSELAQRVTVIKRFKELLKAQRDRFQTYLNALDKQKGVIESGTADDLLRHVELEEKIVEDIFSIQKVIDPLEKMYHSAKTEGPVKKVQKYGENNTGDEEVTGLRDVLEDLKTEAAIRSNRNRELLAKRISELRSEIKSLKSSAYARRKFTDNLAPSLIDIKG